MSRPAIRHLTLRLQWGHFRTEMSIPTSKDKFDDLSWFLFNRRLKRMAVEIAAGRAPSAEEVHTELEEADQEEALARSRLDQAERGNHPDDFG